MWFKWLIALAVFTTFVRELPTGAQPSAKVESVAATNLTWWPAVNLGGLQRWPTAKAVSTNIIETVRVGNLLPPVRVATPKGLSSAVPKPGVYRTTPFACIVIVPAKQPDDTMAVVPGENAPAMPILKPELHFVPVR